MDTEAEKIAGLIHRKLNTAEVILFGSHAYGSPRPDSDIDVCIIVDSAKSKIDIMREIRREAVSFQTRPLDLLVYTRSEFSKKSSTEGLERIILTKGVKMYG